MSHNTVHLQASFDVNRDKIVTKVMNDLDHALNIDEDPPVLEDNTRDLHRAFKEFVKNMNPEKKEDIKRKVYISFSIIIIIYNIGSWWPQWTAYE